MGEPSKILPEIPADMAVDITGFVIPIHWAISLRWFFITTQ
jgi:hypothetical protein